MASSKTVKCFLSFRNADACGEFKGNQDLVLLSECKNDITAHLQRCHLSKGGINSEGELIMMRAGFLYATKQQFPTTYARDIELISANTGEIRVEVRHANTLNTEERKKASRTIE